MALPIDNFDSYSAGSNLSGDNGGSNWSNSWQVSTGTPTTETAPAGGQGGVAASFAGSGNVRANRSFTGNTFSSGTFAWLMRSTDTSPTDFAGVILADNLDDRIYIKFASGNIQYYDGAYNNYGAASANTWYTITVEVDVVGQPGKYRLKVDSGSFTSWVSTAGGILAAIQQYKIDHSASSSYTLWVDGINDTTPPPSTAIKTFDELAYASTKVVDGLALASVKTWNGLA